MQVDAPSDANIDSLVELLVTAGKALEAGGPDGCSRMDGYFDRLAMMLAAAMLRPRARCKLRVRARACPLLQA